MSRVLIYVVEFLLSLSLGVRGNFCKHMSNSACDIYADTPVIECAHLCSESSRCTAFDVEPATMTCYLHTEDISYDRDSGDTKKTHTSLSFHGRSSSWSKTPEDCFEVVLRRYKPGAAKDVSQGKGTSSCSEVKRCGRIHKDGEYWMYPDLLLGSKVKVYCYGMDMATPREFISLLQENFMNYPPMCNHFCKGEGSVDCPTYNGMTPGYTEYTKIRINTSNLQVDRQDQTFATGNGSLMDYGSTADCYNEIWDANVRTCGPVGSFRLDLTGTGFKFSSEAFWEPAGWKAAVYVSWSEDKALVNGTCGGWCGGCSPNKLKLEHNPTDSFVDEGATEVRCKQSPRKDQS